jgi:hypothetical protein
MRTHSIRRAGAVLLTVAAGVSLLLGASRAPPAGGHRAPVQTTSAQTTSAQTRAVQGAPVQATGATVPGVSGAYQFLNQMMDLYATGPVPRLVQSYTGGVLGAQDYTASSSYDDALVVDAYLAERTAGGRARAEAVGNAMLFALARSAPQGGGLYDEYTPAPLYLPADVQPASGSRTTGNAAWAGNALVQLYADTGARSYLTGAENLAAWIQANSADTRGPGGYTGGYANSGTRLEWKSTEQNIDVYAFFSLLGRQSGLATWAARAGLARRFVVSMWNPAAGRFSLGTTTDGVTINDSPQAEDVNSWSYLALQSPAYAASVGWDVRNLASATGRLRGVSICPGDRTGVWFEGTAHLAEALTTRAQPGDSAQAAAYLTDIAYAQAHGPDEDGLGIMAASKDGLTDCEGDSVYASLHTGTTAWYILAAQRVNPLSATTPISAQ